MNIQIVDVTLRDGLQMESKILSMEEKFQLFEKLSKCPYTRIECTSFVPQKILPQFGDSEELSKKIFHFKKNRELMAFVPNLHGLEHLLKFPFDWVSTFIATSETFNQKNIKKSIQETLSFIQEAIKLTHKARRKIRVYVSTVFGCPYEKKVSEKKILSLIEKLSSFNPDELALSDTIGVAVPGQVQSILKKVDFPKKRIALHFHNTYGLALSSIAMAIECGISIFDGSTGGVGGCPYAKGATGNIPSELIHYFLTLSGKTKPSFEPIRAAFFLKQLGVTTHSPLIEIKEKGGEIYGL